MSAETELEERIIWHKMFREFTRHDGWKVFEGIMKKALANRMSAIIQVDCTETGTAALRGEIALLHMLLRTPELMDHEVEAWQKKVEGLRTRRERMQHYGLDKNPYPEERSYES